MALHEVQLKGYSVRPGNLSLGTFDSYGIEQLHVTLDDTWSGLAVTATFNPPKGEPVEIRVPENGLIDVPAEATANEGTGAIVYCGVANGVQLITKTQGYNVITHANVGGTEPFNPSESLATQVLQAALKAEKNSAEANTAAQSAQTAAESAAVAAKASAESASKAAAEAAAAKPYAESAKASAEAARNSENQAQQSSAEANTAKNAAQNAQAGAESSATAAAKSAKEAAASAVNLDSAANTATQKAAAASTSATAAKASESAAASSEAAARKYANSAESAAKTAGEAAAAAAKAKTAAESAQADAAASKAAAANSATQANQSANAAANSAIAAKTSEDAAAKSAADSNNTANSIKDSMTQIAANKAAVSQLKEDLGEVKKVLNIVSNSSIYNFEWEYGYIDITGNNVASNSFMRTKSGAYYTFDIVSLILHISIPTGYNVSVIRYTDNNGTYDSTATYTSDKDYPLRVGSYYRFMIQHGSGTQNLEDTQNVLFSNPDYGQEKNEIEKLNGKITLLCVNRLYGKTMAILGDSMAKGHTLKEEQTWAYKIASRNGMTYQKFAKNGMFITTGHGDADANCLLEQAKKINNNPDVIVIHMGTNDRNSNVELGTWTSENTDTTNMFGALRVAFTYLAENFPLAQVMFITPYYYQEHTDYIGSIEKVCMYVGWHCKNNKQGGIWAWNPNVRNTFFIDSVHLNEAGQERVSYEYEGFMRTFM